MLEPSLHIRSGLLLVLIAIVVTMAAGCEKKAPKLRVGQALPDITVRDGDGNSVQLRELIAGKLAVLLFWEKGCPYCKREMPLLEPLYTKYHGSGFVIVGIHVGPGTEAIAEAVRDNALTFPMLEDPEAASRDAYGLVAVPSILVVKPGGLVDEKILGGLPADGVEAMIQEKL